MIATALPMHPDGFAFDLSCPVVLCDHCRLPIDVGHSGNALWEEGRNSQVRHSHKGACDRAIDPQNRMLSQAADDWLRQLAHNFAHPLMGAEITDYDGRTFRVKEIEVRP